MSLWERIEDAGESLLSGAIDSLDPRNAVDNIKSSVEAVGDAWQDVKELGRKIDDWGEKKEEDKRDPLNSFATIQRQGETEKVPVAYGRCSIAGIRVFVSVSGVTNQFLNMVHVISEGPIKLIDHVIVDDYGSTDPRFAGLFLVSKHTGEDNQIYDASLVSAVPLFTTTDTFAGLAYAWTQCAYDQNIFNGEPKFRFSIEGKNCYDMRTAGTIQGSTNPALVLWDYLTNARYGKGLSSSDLDTASFSAAANYCDELIPSYFGGGSNVKRWEFNGVLDTSKSILYNVKEILASFNAWLTFTSGKYKLICDKDETTAFDFNVDNIIGGWSFANAGIASRYNRVVAEFNFYWAYTINGATKHSLSPTTRIVDVPSFRTADGKLREDKISLPHINNYTAASNLAELRIKQSRQQLSCSFVASLAALKVEVGNVVSVTHPTPGWTAKTFRVVALELRQDATVSVSLREHDATVYNLEAAIDAPTLPDTSFPDPNTALPPTNLSLASGTNELVIGTAGSIVSRIRATWTPAPDIFVTGYELEIKKSAEATWRPAAYATGLNNSEAYIGPVVDGVTHDVRLRSVNSRGKKSTWVTVSSYLVIGKTEPPPDVTSFLVSRMGDGTRQYSWTYASPPADLAGFEIRYKLSTGWTWDQMGAVSGAETLPGGIRTWENNQLAAGVYTIAIKAKDTTGNYSNSAKFIQVDLGDPRIAGQLLAESPRNTSWPGTKTSCFKNFEGDLEATDSTTWATLPATWATWDRWSLNPATTIAYEHTVIDVGSVATFSPLISVTSNGTQTIEIATSNDNVTYSAWATPPGTVTCRYVKARVSVSVSLPTIAVISDMIIIFSADVIEETIEDLNTATLTGAYDLGVGDVRLPITKTYTSIRNVYVTLQNVGSGCTWELKDKDASVGPRIVIWNGVTKIDCVIDVRIIGI